MKKHMQFYIPLTVLLSFFGAFILSYQQVDAKETQSPVTHEDTIVSSETDQEVAYRSWNTEMVGAPYAWNEGVTGAGVNIAVIDTGFNADHPDITYAGGASIFEDDPWTNDHTGHGTHVSGIIGASLDSPYPGVAPGANIYGIKVYHENSVNAAGYPTTDVANITAGIYKAMEFNPDMIVISSGFRQDDPDLRQAVQKAIDQRVVVLAASGNNQTSIDYPAAYPEVLSITALDQEYNTASDSIYSLENNFTAPGVSVTGLSSPASPAGYPYATFSGSSQAVPHAAGVMALLMERYGMNAQGAESVLTDISIDLGYRGRFGHGLVHYLSPYRRAQLIN